MCTTYFSADAQELSAIRESRYLNLQFPGDRQPERRDAPVVPWRAHRGLVGGGMSVREVTLLAELVGGIPSLGPDWPSERVLRLRAFGNGFSAMAFQVSPETLEVLATIRERDIPALAARWDRTSRALEAAPAFGPDSVDECTTLLAELVAIARDARYSNRDMWVVESLASYVPSCQSLGGCGGYGCKSPVLFDAENVCHSAQDGCLHVFDCPALQSCQYDHAARRWSCRSRGPE